jgi:hypothetical protein
LSRRPESKSREKNEPHLTEAQLKAAPDLWAAIARTDALTYAEGLYLDHGNRDRAGFAEDLEILRALGREANAVYKRLREECGLD